MDEMEPINSKSAAYGRSLFAILQHYMKVRDIILKREEDGEITSAVALEAIRRAKSDALVRARPHFQALKTMEFRS